MSPTTPPADPQPTIWTIGHSSRSAEEFEGLLSSAGVAVLADVRRHPGSRTHPQFNAGRLAERLPALGIEYIPFPELGGRRAPRPDSVNTAWRNESFRGYADYMNTAEYAAGLERLMATARERPTCIMCSEAVWWRCHRALIADALKVRGWRVLHIIDGPAVSEHPYTSAARVVDGRLSYGPGVGPFPAA